jgi:hypothetical protein
VTRGRPDPRGDASRSADRLLRDAAVSAEHGDLEGASHLLLAAARMLALAGRVADASRARRVACEFACAPAAP